MPDTPAASAARQRHDPTPGYARPARGTIQQVASCQWCRRPVSSARHPVTVWVHEGTGRVECDD